MATLTKSGNQVTVIDGDKTYVVPIDSVIWKSPWNENDIIIDREGNFSSVTNGLTIDWTDITGISAASRDEMVTALTALFNSTEEAAIGSTTDAPASSTDAETAAAKSSISLLKGIKNVLLLIKGLFTDGTQKTQIADPATHPTILDIADELDTTDGSVIYRGYKRGASYLVAKQVISGALITTTWAIGAWADRATLTYA